MPKRSKSTVVDEKFMRRALDLAAKGRGRVSPNPMVGCVIVKDGRILSEGYHKKYGGSHAEVDALKKIGFAAPGATFYVTLEPCHHFGKTPPCVDAVLKSGAKRVVIAMTDPNPLTDKKSVRKLREAGIAVTVGVLEAEARELNRGFVKRIATGRPYVIAKAGLSLDGKISTRKGHQGWLTGEAASRYVQRLRCEVDAILIGRGTLAIDDPLLNVRDAKRPQPIRVILDSRLRTSSKSRVFRSHGGPVWIVTGLKSDHPKARLLERAGARIFTVPVSRDGLQLPAVLRTLAGNGVNFLLVEGGTEIFSNFYRAKLVDEWQFLIAPRMIGEKGQPAFNGANDWHFHVQRIQALEEDTLLICQPL